MAEAQSAKLEDILRRVVGARLELLLERQARAAAWQTLRMTKR